MFCDIVARKIPTDFVYEDDAIVAFADLRPIAPKHILIIPKEHSDTLVHAADSPDSERMLGRLLRAAADLGKSWTESDGYRVVINNGPAAGQTVYHLHLHLLAGRHFAWPPG